MRPLRSLGGIVLCVFTVSSQAQTIPSSTEAPVVPKPPPRSPSGEAEDYTYLRDYAARTEWLNSLTYVSLSDQATGA